MVYNNGNSTEDKNVNRCKHGISPENCCALCNEFKRQEQEAQNEKE